MRGHNIYPQVRLGLQNSQYKKLIWGRTKTGEKSKNKLVFQDEFLLQLEQACPKLTIYLMNKPQKSTRKFGRNFSLKVGMLLNLLFSQIILRFSWVLNVERITRTFSHIREFHDQLE